MSGNLTLEYYNKNAEKFVNDTICVDFVQTQKKFLSTLQKGAKILDFGCGSGRDTKYFLGQGFQVEAVDGSEKICEIASALTGISVKKMLFQELDAVEKYDGIWACSSVLHLSKTHLKDVLRKMIYAVRRNGIIYMSFKYGQFEGIRNGRYFTDFTEDTFILFMKNTQGVFLEEYWITGDVRQNRGEEKWLQVHNPEVPGLVHKLAPLDEKMRRLSKVRKLWEGILDIHLVADVFTGGWIDKTDYDVDHFIPWSFVMNDELWNLMPMNPSLNSSKSNKLPKWEPFFARFAENQFILYQLVHDNEGIYRLYEKCYKDNLHSIWANRELYREGNCKDEFINILSKNMRPIYDSAKRQGYETWRL